MEAYPRGEELPGVPHIRVIVQYRPEGRCFFMKLHERKKLIGVEASTAAGFAEAFNHETEKLAGAHYEIIWNLDAGHCCYQMVTTTEYEPENLKDEYELRGDTHYCHECPYLEPQKDMRQKYTNCICGRTTPTSECCLKFYQEMERGTLVPR